MHRWMFCVLFSLLSHHDRYIAEKVRPIGSSELSQSVSKVFKEANIDCEKEMTEQVTEERADDADIFLLYFQDRIMLSDIADIRKRTQIPQEYYDYVDDSNAFSQVHLKFVFHELRNLTRLICPWFREPSLVSIFCTQITMEENMPLRKKLRAF